MQNRNSCKFKRVMLYFIYYYETEVSAMHAAIKPHHFLDYMYEMAAYNGVFDTVMANGSDYSKYGALIAAGKINTVTFTTGADDPCGHCKNLLDGICQDRFVTPEAIATRK